MCEHDKARETRCGEWLATENIVMIDFVDNVTVDDASVMVDMLLHVSPSLVIGKSQHFVRVFDSMCVWA